MALMHSESTWSEIAAHDVPPWNTRLLTTRARVEQYPYFNERFRSPLVTPRYLVCGAAHDPVAYACVLTVSAWPVRLGLVANGPASLTQDRVPPDAMRGFSEWAARNRYAFVRVTHPDAEFLERLEALGNVEVADPFRHFLAPESELVVPLVESDEALAGGFQEVARRLIRQAGRAGYRIATHETPDSLAALWPFFEAHAKRKGLTYRPLERYMALMRLAEPDRCARLYVAEHEGRVVNAILLLRDREMAHYQLGALDVEALGSKPSPSCLLHFRAMHDFQRMGASAYNLGIRAGPVYTFKKKFRPVEIFYPKPRVIVLKPALHRLWQRFVGESGTAFTMLLRALRR